MQSKILAVAVTALSFASVDAAILPRATITPGNIVLPEVVFNPSEISDPIFRGLDIIRTDVGKTAGLVGDLTRSASNNIKDRTDQVTAVVRQVTSNANAIRQRAGYITSGLLTSLPGAVSSGAGAAPSPTAPGGSGGAPSPPAINGPDIVNVSQEIVRQAQALARNVTAQLSALQTQITGTTDLASRTALTLAYTQASLGLGVVLSTVGAAVNILLSTVSSLLVNVVGVVERVRDAQVKLNPVLAIGATPDVTF